MGGRLSDKRQTEAHAEMHKMAQHLRRQFYSAVSQPPVEKRPVDFFAWLSSVWRTVTNAKSTWLWLKNKHTNHWEIMGAADPLEVVDLPHLPLQIPGEMAPNARSIAELASLIPMPVYVDEISQFKQVHDGIQYKVACADWFRDNHITAFDAIPFATRLSRDQHQSNHSSSGSKAVHLVGVVCNHYGESSDRQEHEPESLRIMGDLTAQAIAYFYEVLFRRILMKLNDLADRYLTTVTKRPDKDRAQYLQQVISIIQSELGVDAVSVFYRDADRPRISCLQTTGLCTRTPDCKRISDPSLPDVVYEIGEGRTGTCFSSGEPIFLPRSDKPSDEAKYLELAKDGVTPLPGPTFLAPIPPSSARAAQQSKGSPRADGVIRCAGHPSPLDSHRQRHFDPMETQTLQFICRQISPILHTFAVREQREHQISLIKHDLDAPLRMIADTVAEIKRRNQSAQPAPEYRFLDLDMALAAAWNLGRQLEADPREEVISPQRTLLEGDIIAHNAAMLRHYATTLSDMSIYFDSFKEIPPLYVDRDAITRVFYNLIVNAIKYGNSGTQIRVSPRTTAKGFAVDVANYGIGVSAEDVPHIFETYYRSAAARSKRQGAGLGLSIARVLMEKHGGRLELTSANDPTVFTMFFPSESKWDRRS
ncbi:MAG TPA: sensor histidine kinase [Planctomycetaceae bacterium]|jgi:signal transduction histidine kinase|nr:sensor histidine kinase [Planctomycetaceae bacterium]